jgi:hypothetical protein
MTRDRSAFRFQALRTTPKQEVPFITEGLLMKRFSLLVLALYCLCSWSLMPSILVGTSLAIAADQTELLDLNTAPATNEELCRAPGMPTQRRSSDEHCSCAHFIRSMSMPTKAGLAGFSGSSSASGRVGWRAILKWTRSFEKSTSSVQSNATRTFFSNRGSFIK